MKFSTRILLALVAASHLGLAAPVYPRAVQATPSELDITDAGRSGTPPPPGTPPGTPPSDTSDSEPEDDPSIPPPHAVDAYPDKKGWPAAVSSPPGKEFSNACVTGGVACSTVGAMVSYAGHPKVGGAIGLAGSLITLNGVTGQQEGNKDPAGREALKQGIKDGVCKAGQACVDGAKKVATDPVGTACEVGQACAGAVKAAACKVGEKCKDILRGGPKQGDDEEMATPPGSPPPPGTPPGTPPPPPGKPPAGKPPAAGGPSRRRAVRDYEDRVLAIREREE